MPLWLQALLTVIGIIVGFTVIYLLMRKDKI
ncbi:MAG: hypothetical protein JG770_2101 [Mahella sp.]|nr:hypothetical protein [Mahella sp.]